MDSPIVGGIFVCISVLVLNISFQAPITNIVDMNKEMKKCTPSSLNQKSVVQCLEGKREVQRADLNTPYIRV